METYISVDYANEFWDARINPIWDNASQEEKQAAIIWATEALDSMFEYPGRIQNINQKLNFPRIDAYDKQGRLLRGIPDPVKRATAYLAGQHIESPIFKVLDRGGRISSVVAGSVRVEWERGATPHRVFRYVSRVMSDIVGRSRSNIKLVRS